jgi:hypothetical protein
VPVILQLPVELLSEKFVQMLREVPQGILHCQPFLLLVQVRVALGSVGDGGGEGTGFGEGVEGEWLRELEGEELFEMFHNNQNMNKIIIYPLGCRLYLFLMGKKSI